MGKETRLQVVESVWIDDIFPGLVGPGYSVTSSPTDQYNCIAWAAEDDSEWWSHLQSYRWPADRTHSVESLVAVFVSLGYEVCDSNSLEEGYDKVAIYAHSGLWKHAARQLPSGQWTSKLGPDEDIEHTTLEGLCGEPYGIVHCIMRRRLT